MWQSIISSLLPIAIKILNAYFKNKSLDADARASYLKFLESMQKAQSTPAKLKASYEDQIKRLREGL